MITAKSCVLMSVYKNDKVENVRQAVDSILQQTYTDFVFYILCDGVVDATVADYLRTLDDRRIALRCRDENKGLARSLNELLTEALQHTAYHYFFRMDADDIAFSDRLEKQVHYMDTHQDVDCLGTWAIEINSLGEEYFRKQMPVSHDECNDLFRKRDCVIHPTVVFRRTYFDKAGLYPEDTYFAEDTMMWAKGFKNACRFANLPEYLFYFRLDENFFQRRRGWKHALSIYKLRCHVNAMLNYPRINNLHAMLYALAKMMPTRVLKLLYKILR